MSASSLSAAAPPTADTHDRRHLGAPAITMIIIAASAPLTVIAGGATTAFSVTGSIAVPVGYIVLAVILAVFAVGYAAMSRFITNAGAFYSYASQGIGRPVGVGVSLIALVAYNCMQIGIYGIFGFQVSIFLAEKFGWDIPWWVGIIICIAIVAALGVNRVDLSAKVLGVLVLLEFVAVIIFDVAAFANPAEGFTAAPISPTSLLLPGLGAVLVFGIAAFMGFESAAIYSEEAKDPKRTVARATFAAVIIIGVFYALSSWALALAIGPEKIASGGITLEEAGPPLFFNFVYAALGPIMVDFMSILFITSLFAALVSFHNAVARYFFALGREGVLPSGLSRVRERTGAPWAGSVTQTVLALVVVVIFAIAGSRLRARSALPGGDAVHVADQHRGPGSRAADGGRLARRDRLLPPRPPRCRHLVAPDRADSRVRRADDGAGADRRELHRAARAGRNPTRRPSSCRV